MSWTATNFKPGRVPPVIRRNCRRSGSHPHVRFVCQSRSIGRTRCSRVATDLCSADGGVMNSKARLKVLSACFALFWTVWMVLWSGAYSLVNILVLALGGVLVGWAWYAGMRRLLLKSIDAQS